MCGTWATGLDHHEATLCQQVVPSTGYITQHVLAFSVTPAMRIARILETRTGITCPRSAAEPATRMQAKYGVRIKGALCRALRLFVSGKKDGGYDIECSGLINQNKHCQPHASSTLTDPWHTGLLHRSARRLAATVVVEPGRRFDGARQHVGFRHVHVPRSLILSAGGLGRANAKILSEALGSAVQWVHRTDYDDTAVGSHRREVLLFASGPLASTALQRLWAGERRRGRRHRHPPPNTAISTTPT